MIAADIERAHDTKTADVLAMIRRKVVLVSPVNRLDVFQTEISKVAPAIVAKKRFVADPLQIIKTAHPDREGFLAAIRADAVLNAAHAEFLDAVDNLQAIADESGLISTFGQDVVRQVLANALAGATS